MDIDYEALLQHSPRSVRTSQTLQTVRFPSIAIPRSAMTQRATAPR